MTTNKNAPLSYEIKDDKLVISIGISALAFAALEENGGIEGVKKVLDENAWAKDVLREIENSDNMGYIIDQGMIRALEGDSKSIIF